MAPQPAAAWIAASQQALRQGDAAAALDAADRAVALEPANPVLRLQRATCLLALSRRREALDAAEAAQRCAPTDPRILDAVGTLCSNANEQQRALGAYDRAVALAPHEARFHYNRAAVRRFVGDLEGAEADYDRAIELQPRDYEAYLNRSELRVQTDSRNHVAELEALAAQPFADWRSEVQVCYALAKEYEDLGRYAQSFDTLRRGAGLRRAHMSYDVGTDVATVDWIIEAFPRGPGQADDRPAGAAGSSLDTAGAVSSGSGGDRLGTGSVGSARGASGALGTGSAGSAGSTGSAGAAPRAAGDSPIFIVGLPRSGSTLVERILGSHSSLTSAGELDSFALAIVDAARRRRGGAAVPRRELVALAAEINFPEVGLDYLRRARAAIGGESRFIDKMPLNYLYCGLIRRALPNARIIHTTRQPLAAGYAMYKTLFKDGYPFSYDLRDIARYYIAYRRLMDHWRATMPKAIHEVSYEQLVSDPAGETRKLLAYCGLEWQDACADFHENPRATTTASAAQVRRPLYQSSVAQWRHYAAQLAPLRDALETAGMELGPL